MVLNGLKRSSSQQYCKRSSVWETKQLPNAHTSGSPMIGMLRLRESMLMTHYQGLFSDHAPVPPIHGYHNATNNIDSSVQETAAFICHFLVVLFFTNRANTFVLNTLEEHKMIIIYTEMYDLFIDCISTSL